MKVGTMKLNLAEFTKIRDKLLSQEKKDRKAAFTNDAEIETKTTEKETHIDPLHELFDMYIKTKDLGRKT
jgi:hypothetical protein